MSHIFYEAGRRTGTRKKVSNGYNREGKDDDNKSYDKKALLQVARLRIKNRNAVNDRGSDKCVAKKG
jgi:hypothetical protein